MSGIIQNLGTAGATVLILCVAVLLGVVFHAVLFFILKKIAKSTSTGLDNQFVFRMRGPFRLLIPLLFVSIAMALTPEVIPREIRQVIHSVTQILYIITFAWVLLGLINYLQDFLLRRYQLDIEDNLQARRMHTQMGILRKLAAFIIILLAIVAILMQFEALRSVGTGILASAGLAGIIVGFAAQKTIGNLLAGIQMAITQPIRLDDVVVVEGEWGRIEEITLTYVVVRIWDQRRLILPISYFIEKPFQNWTRESSDISGTVHLYLDYAVPVGAVRDQLQNIVEASKNWDGKVCGLQVTDTTDKTVELRALVSASNSGAAWNLRCEVREKLIEFLKTKYPHCLPALRVSLQTHEQKEQVQRGNR